MTAVTVSLDRSPYLASPTLQDGLVSARTAERTVLVVDDEEVVRILLARALTEAGYRVIQANSGVEAAGLLERDAIAMDLIICDLVMPVMSGRDLARWLGTRRPELPILFISGYPKAYLEAHDLYDPGIPLLRKPFLPSRLLESVEEMLTVVGGGG